jgi:hypothetical protein
MTISLCEKSNCCQLLSMGMSCLNCHPSIRMFTTLPNCKAWTKSMMAMLGVNWSQLIKKIHLGLASGKLVAWVTCIVCRMIVSRMIVKTLCTLPLVMRHFDVVSAFIF